MDSEKIFNQSENFDTGYYELMINTLNTVYQDGEMETRISNVLGMIGSFIDVSRVYIFEDDKKKAVSNNTYEWCAHGVAPQIDILQNVPFDEIDAWHGMLRDPGIVLADDARTLPSEIYDILEPQEVCSIVVLPLYINNNMIGYIGFDECRQYRNWTNREIEVLRALDALVTNLIAQRNAEKEVEASHEILRTVLDNIETPIYVTDIETSEILFANKKFSEEVKQDDVEGKICWKLLKRNQDGVCEDCARKKLVEMGEGAAYNWEVYNKTIGKWFYCTDSLIEWTDGRKAHLQASLDITDRKKHEEKLKFNATYDIMTGIYNRESGMRFLSDITKSKAPENFPFAFCFIDIDNLKEVNDTYGHTEGDKLVVTIVEAIKQSIRSQDVFARLGGDEFMLLFKACSQKNAERKIGKISKELDDINQSGKYPYKLSISIGILEVKSNRKYDVDDILVIADERMYMDKRTKSNNPGLNKKKSKQKI